jgi:hypothetical protein
MLIIVATYSIAMAGIYSYNDGYISIDFDTISPKNLSHWGYKLGVLALVNETAMQTTLWSVKGCFLIIFNRLT